MNATPTEPPRVLTDRSDGYHASADGRFVAYPAAGGGWWISDTAAHYFVGGGKVATLEAAESFAASWTADVAANPQGRGALAPVWQAERAAQREYEDAWALPSYFPKPHPASPASDPPLEPPVGTVLETRDGDDVYRIEHLPDGWAIQYRPGESEHGATHTGSRISWRSAWSAWGPPSGAEPFTEVPPDAPPLPPYVPEPSLDLDCVGGSGAVLDRPPAAEPHRPPPPSPRSTPPRTTTSSTGAAMTATINDVQAGIAMANDQASESLGALQQAHSALEQSQAGLMHATEGSHQADVSEATGLLAKAIGSIVEVQQAVAAAIQASEGVAGRL